jgi:hypothetical protein
VLLWLFHLANPAPRQAHRSQGIFEVKALHMELGVQVNKRLLLTRLFLFWRQEDHARHNEQQ